MQISAEIRWFWNDEDTALTAAAERWFAELGDGMKPGGGKDRSDIYLLIPGKEGGELGVKRRGKKPGCEVKGLISYLTPIFGGPFNGAVELWGKWSCSSLSVDGQESIETVKRRWLRKLDFDSEGLREIELDEDEKPLDKSERLPTLGCHVELTRVTLGASRIWWTVGFEAFGPASQVERILHRAVGASQKAAPDFSSAVQRSYPAWLMERTTEGK
jgi:hypothetical protein